MAVARRAPVAPRVRKRRRPRKARLSLDARPSSLVSLNGRQLGRTPIRNYSLSAGTYKIIFRRDKYKSETRTVTLRAGQTRDLDVSLERIPEPRRAAPRPARPRPSGPQAKHPFRTVRLSRKKRLRIYITDPRGLGGRHSTLQLRKLAGKIERETSRLLGGGFRVRGITRAWQRTVRDRATQRNVDYHTFYPRAVAYVIYRGLLRGRSSKRVAQLLVKYEYRNRFKRIRN